MGQIILNYIFIFVIPLIVGLALRLLFRRVKRAYWITVGLLIFAVAAWVIAATVPTHGSERYGLLAVQMTSGAIGALLTGLVIHWKRKKGKTYSA